MVGELEELVVLTLFHDVYYYDDFPHHDSRTLDLFKPYLRHTIPAQVELAPTSYLLPDHSHVSALTCPPATPPTFCALILKPMA